MFGLGRSGLGVAQAAVARGESVIVVDEANELAKPELLSDARKLGVTVETNWSGEFSDIQPIDTVVTNPAVPMDHPKLAAAVKQGIDVISEVEYAFRIAKAPILAITGTNGKSTTTVMTWLILQAAGVKARLCGNLYGSGYPEETLTMAALEAKSDEVLVAEISSFQLEWVARFRPIAAAITTISEDHLNRYAGSMERYTAVKRQIWAAQTPSDTAVTRFGSPEEKFARALKGPLVKTFGPGGDVDFSRVEKWLPHNQLNAASAALLALRVLPDFDVNDMTMQGLRNFQGLAHRLEDLGSKDGIQVINNSMCTNPDAVIASAASNKARIHLIVGGVNKGLDFKPLANYLSSGKDHVYLFGQDRHEIGSVLAQTIPEPPQFLTMEEAFIEATNRANAGEIIMLAPGCASTDQFRDFIDRGNVFKAIIKKWLGS